MSVNFKPCTLCEAPAGCAESGCVYTTVHVLHEGLALCRFSTMVPANWPEGHKWVALGTTSMRLSNDVIPCEECGRIAGKITFPREAKQ